MKFDKIISIDEKKCISEIIYKSGIFKWIQRSTTEYINKSEFSQYDITIRGFGPAFFLNFINVKNFLKYYKNDKDQYVDINNNFKEIYIEKKNDVVISEIKYSLDIPIVLYVFRSYLKIKDFNINEATKGS